MIKILIVDDECWVAESLKASINWNQMGFEVIGMANNGSQALEMIRELKPSIVFTDIRMPLINGLELIKKVNDLNLGILFIVTSGYAEFAYAQKAIAYGAIGYCLKPFDDAEIINCLNRAKQLLERKRAVNESLPTYSFAENEEARSRKISILLIQQGINPETEEIAVISSLGKDKLVLTEGALCIAVKAGEEKWIYFCKSDDIDAVILRISRQDAYSVKGIGIVDGVRGIKEIIAAIGEASVLAYGFFMNGKKGVFGSAATDSAPLKSALSQLETHIRNKDLNAIDNTFEALGVLIRDGNFSIKAAYFVYNMCMRFSNSFEDLEEDIIDSYEKLANAFHSACEMLAYLHQRIKRYLDVIPDYSNANIENKIVKEILQYVNTNFYKDISIQALSKKFFINPSYISQLFKREVGMNYVEYITKVRIDYACKLLRESSLPVQQISEKSGYSDYFYFTRSFKKNTGRTPSEYRNEP